MFRVHEQIEEDLLQLSLGAEREQRFGRRQVANADSGSLPIAFAEFDQAAEQRADIDGAGLYLFGGGEGDQAGDHAGGLGGFRRDGRNFAFGGSAVGFLQRLLRQVRNGGQRGLQFVHYAGDQPSHGRHFFRAEELLLHASLIEQADGHADLIAEVLREGLFIGGEIAHPVVLVQFQHADDFALRDHGDEQEALG